MPPDVAVTKIRNQLEIFYLMDRRPGQICELEEFDRVGWNQ